MARYRPTYPDWKNQPATLATDMPTFLENALNTWRELPVEERERRSQWAPAAGWSAAR